MRILSIGNFGTSWDGSICDEEHIARALEAWGHKVIRQQREIGWDTPVPDVDFVLIAQWDGYPERMGFKDAGIPLVYWAFDYQADGQEWHERLVKQADLYLSKPLSDSKYPNWQWLPADFSPDFLEADWSTRPEKDIDVLFTGSYLPWAKERLDVLKAVDQKYDLQIYSVTPDQWKEAGFKNVHGPVMDQALNELIPRARVNLSIDHTITPGYWSDRNAQIMACGGSVLFHYVPMSEIVFGDAVGYFYNKEDCLKQLGLLLPQNLTVFEMYAWNYATQHLMVTNRVQQLLTIVGQTL